MDRSFEGVRDRVKHLGGRIFEAALEFREVLRSDTGPLAHVCEPLSSRVPLLPNDMADRFPPQQLPVLVRSIRKVYDFSHGPTIRR